MASADKGHWIRMKNTKLHEKKKLLNKNADILRKIGSSSFTDAQKIPLKQDLKQNRNKIKTLDDQINEVENNISPKSTNDVLPTYTVRGRSQTREPKHRYASPSHPQRSPRSVSSSPSRKKNHPTDDDKLGIMQRLLETYKAENARLERQLYAESRRYGEEIYQLMSKKPHKENDIFRLRLQKADLSIHHRELLEENKHLREMNYHLRLETEKKFSSSLKALEAEKQSLTAILQSKNKEIIKFTLEVDDMKRLIDNLFDEKQRTANEIDYLNDRINRQESDHQEKLREIEDLWTKETKYLQKEYDNMKEAYQRVCLNEETLKWKQTELAKQNQKLMMDAKENKTSALKKITQNQRIKDLQSMIEYRDLEEKRLSSKIKKQEQELREYGVKNEELGGKLTKEMMKCESLQASVMQHKQERDMYSSAVEKAYEHNANLNERLKIETEDKGKLQRENKRLTIQIDSTRREKEQGRGISERLAHLQSKYDNLQEAYNRECRNVETLKWEENEMKRTVEEMQRRNEALERDAKENETSKMTQIKLTQQIIQLQSNIKEKDAVKESLRSNVDDLEKENRELQLRLKQLEKKHKNEADSLKPNYTDLEKKAKLLHEENEKLLQNATKERNKAENIQTDLDNEKRRSEELRERIEDLERLWQTDHVYKSEAKTQITNHTDLEKKVKQLQEENERHLQKETQERNRAEHLQSKLHDEKRLTVELHAKIEELKKERMKFSEKQDAIRKQVSDEKDKEQIRIKRLEAFHKKETDAIQQKLAELQKSFNLVQEERDNLRESEETERNIGEKAQLELEDAKREKEKLQERIKKLERQITEVPKLDPYLSGENRQLKEEVERLRKEVKNARQEDAENDENIRRYERQVEALKREKRQAIAEKESALTRLSALAGDRLRDNNAAIADLSDENRPINLGEKFSELYDNQWTDAIEKLEKLMSERDAIQKLLEMIKGIYDVCRNLAKDQLELIAKAFGFEERKEKLKRLKDLRKSMASENISDIKKKVNNLCVSKTFSRESSDCSSYISRSVELCWYMCIQDPPVILEFNATHGQVFDDKIYRHFTKSGKTIDYMVWPVMYLHSNGPLLQKGVVQPI